MVNGKSSNDYHFFPENASFQQTSNLTLRKQFKPQLEICKEKLQELLDAISFTSTEEIDEEDLMLKKQMTLLKENILKLELEDTLYDDERQSFRRQISNIKIKLQYQQKHIELLKQTQNQYERQKKLLDDRIRQLQAEAAEIALKRRLSARSISINSRKEEVFEHSKIEKLFDKTEHIKERIERIQNCNKRDEYLTINEILIKSMIDLREIDADPNLKQQTANALKSCVDLLNDKTI